MSKNSPKNNYEAKIRFTFICPNQASHIFAREDMAPAQSSLTYALTVQNAKFWLLW